MSAPADEQDVFEYRYLVIQPSLDESVFKLWGALPGIDGRIVEKALTAREGEFPVLPHQGQGQRRADALTSICMDSLTGTSEEAATDRAVTVAEVFIDAGLAAESLRRSRCHRVVGTSGRTQHFVRDPLHRQVRVIVTDGLHPVAYSDLGEAIPSHIRRYVQWRDQNRCSVEGCHSTYRLQPHHIRERQHGGTHDPDNLVTLCWYHHHVAIHGYGFRIDPTSHPPPTTPQTPQQRTAAGLCSTFRSESAPRHDLNCKLIVDIALRAESAERNVVRSVEVVNLDHP